MHDLVKMCEFPCLVFWPILKYYILNFICGVQWHKNTFWHDSWQSVFVMPTPYQKVYFPNHWHFILFTPFLALSSIAKIISCYNSVLLNRLRIGRFRLTHSYLLSGDDPPTCQSCRVPLTVKHSNGMCQLAGHSWKILHGVFCCRLV